MTTEPAAAAATIDRASAPFWQSISGDRLAGRCDAARSLDVGHERLKYRGQVLVRGVVLPLAGDVMLDLTSPYCSKSTRWNMRCERWLCGSGLA